MTALNKEIKDAIQSDNLIHLLNDAFVAQVNFGTTESDPDTTVVYRIHLLGDFPKKRGDLICLFPNHLPHQRLSLDCASYRGFFGHSTLAAFNRDLNGAFAQSLENTVMSTNIKFAAAFGEHVFACKGIAGTIYIVWAKTIHTVTASNKLTEIAKNHPLLINCDGNGRLKAIFMFRKRVTTTPSLLPLTKGNPILVIPADVELFVCEKRSITATSTTTAYFLEDTHDIEDNDDFDQLISEDSVYNASLLITRRSAGPDPFEESPT